MPRHPSPAVLRLAVSAALLAAFLAVGERAAGQETAEEIPAPPKKRLAVRTAGDDGSLVAAVEGSGVFRWWLSRSEAWEGEVGPGAHGDLTVVAALLPLPEEVRHLAAELPVAFGGEGGLVFSGTSYPEEVAAAFRLPPETGADWLVTGGTTAAVAGLVSQVAAAEMGVGYWGADPDPEADYRLVENPWLERRGRWRRSGERLEPDPRHDRDGYAERADWYAGLREIRAGRVRLRVPAGWESRPEMEALAADLDRALTGMTPRLPADAEGPLIVAVGEDYPTQGRLTGRIGAAVPASTAVSGGAAPVDLHLVYHPDDLFAYRFALARLLVERELPGLPPYLARGAALWFSGEWYGRPWRRWLPSLAAARVLPEASELLAREEPGDASEPLWTPAAAALVDRLPGATLAEKLAQVPGTPAVRALLSAISTEAVETVIEAPGAPTAVPASRHPRRFFSGVSFAMLNGLEVGYHAPAAARSLDALSALGADAVSLMPFAYQPDPRRPELRYLNRSPSSETDIGVIHAARLARERGQAVLWKPHIWSSRGWTGEIAMGSEADWRAWWRSYRRFVAHHALLAGWVGADVLSVGVELGGTLEREREWIELIETARTLFPGPLTYAANWWGDAEEAPFWERLDYLGVDAYYPLSGSTEAGREELVAGAREAARKLEALAARHRRPVLLTEVGFACRRGAWTAPHEEGGELSEADQAAAYEAFFAGLGRPPWLAGVFVWKVFSGDRPERAGRPDFRFLGRRAEREVRRYFAPPEEVRITGQ